jgi:hypothetical protein
MALVIFKFPPFAPEIPVPAAEQVAQFVTVTPLRSQCVFGAGVPEAAALS